MYDSPNKCSAIALIFMKWLELVFLFVSGSFILFSQEVYLTSTWDWK